jgi:hypothetical protein
VDDGIRKGYLQSNKTEIDDFRQPLATHAEFIWQQLSTADSKDRPLKEHLCQPLWGEILPSALSAITPAHHPTRARQRCVVTGYVGNLFEWIFGEGIEIVEPHSGPYGLGSDGIIDDEFLHESELVELLKPEFKQDLPSKKYGFHHAEYGKAVYPRFTTSIKGKVKVGDVVEMGRDDETRWQKSTQKWYAYVTDIWTTPKGDTRLKILWLYWPEDTAFCMAMKYPFSNEVFHL